MKTGICVQIGLCNSAEYLYLVDPNWRELLYEQPVLKQIPSELRDFENWMYVGIDQDPFSIALMMERHSSAERTSWVSTGIKNSDSEIIISGSAVPKSIGLYCAYTQPLTKVLRDLGIHRIDVLAMDIEGAEMEFWETYNWVMLPRYVALEAHYDYADPLKKIFALRGYELILQEETNIGGGIGSTQELHFLLEK